MRLFLAIELPDDVRLHLAGRCSAALSECNTYLDRRQIGGRLTAVPAANLHVTLKFLGDVGESAVAQVSDALAHVVFEPASPVRAGHLELLPPRGPLRVIAAGLDGDIGRVVRMHRAIEDACAAQGFPPERREYLPHITLARARDPVPHERRYRLKQILDGCVPGPDFRVDGFTLFESRLGGGPPTYVPLARFGG